jgi:hypothetical protein
MSWHHQGTKSLESQKEEKKSGIEEAEGWAKQPTVSL